MKSKLFILATMLLAGMTGPASAQVIQLETVAANAQEKVHDWRAEAQKKAEQARIQAQEKKTLIDRSFLKLMDTMTHRQFSVIEESTFTWNKTIPEIEGTYLYHECTRTIMEASKEEYVYCYFYKNPMNQASGWLTIATKLDSMGALESKFSLFATGMGVHSTHTVPTKNLLQKPLRDIYVKVYQSKGLFKKSEKSMAQIGLMPKTVQ